MGKTTLKTISTILMSALVSVNATTLASALDNQTVTEVAVNRGDLRSSDSFQVSVDGQRLWQIVGLDGKQKVVETDLRTGDSKTILSVTPPTGSTRLPVGTKFREFNVGQLEISDDGNYLAVAETDQTYKVTDQFVPNGSFLDGGSSESVGQPSNRWTILDLRSGAKYSVNANSGLASIPRLVFSAATKKLFFEGCQKAKYRTSQGFVEGLSCKVYSSTLLGKGKKIISSADSVFQISPNGRYVAIANRTAISVLNLGTNKRTPIKFASYAKASAARYIQPTNDGKSVLIASRPSGSSTSTVWSLRAINNLSEKVVARGEVSFATLNADNSKVFAATSYKTFAINLKSSNLAAGFLNVKACTGIIDLANAADACQAGFVQPKLELDRVLSCVAVPGDIADLYAFTYSTKLVGGNYSSYGVPDGGTFESRDVLTPGGMSIFLNDSVTVEFGPMNEGSGPIKLVDYSFDEVLDLSPYCN